MRRILLSLILSFLLLAAPAVSVSSVSAEEWSDDDPPMVIVTPQRRVVVVFNTIGAIGAQHKPALRRAKVGYTVAPTSDGKGTKVNIVTTVPDDRFATGFPTRSIVSSLPFGRGKVHGATIGVSGAPMSVQFTLNIP